MIHVIVIIQLLASHVTLQHVTKQTFSHGTECKEFIDTTAQDAGRLANKLFPKERVSLMLVCAPLPTRNA